MTIILTLFMLFVSFIAAIVVLFILFLIMTDTGKCKYRNICLGYTPDTYVCDYAPDDYGFRCFMRKKVNK